MGKIINIDEYRGLKQREFFINLYHFLNKNLDYSLDHILVKLDDDFIDLCKKYNIDPLCVNLFRVPIVTFIVIIFVNNSDIKDFFGTTLSITNYENKNMFKNTLVKSLEVFDEDYHGKKHNKNFEKDMEEIIEKGMKSVLEVVPDKIVLV